jgi:CDP-glucose 4,6-dehydratase
MADLARSPDPFLDVYRGKRVLVTGHTGFKGSWLSLWLHYLGAEVTGFSSFLPSDPCNFEVLNLKTKIQHVEGDIRDFDSLVSVFQSLRPEIVFHLAAQAIVKRSFESPRLTFESNLLGTVNVLESIRTTDSVRSAVFVTSDKCYRNSEWVWGYRENDILGGDDPYSASKACAEIAINSYCQSFFREESGARVASVRAGNVVGGGDWAANRIVPDCIRAWSDKRELVVRNPAATRPWQHVLEPLSGYLWLGAKLVTGGIPGGEAFNFGPRPDTAQPVSKLIQTLARHWENATWRVVDDNAIRESGLLALSCEKARDLLHWRAMLTLDETMQMTAEWYQQYLERPESLLEFSLAQIEQYSVAANTRDLEWSRTTP